MIGRPVDRAALQKSEAQAAAFDDRWRARRREIGAGAGMSDAEPVEPGERGKDRGGAVIDVIGEADRAKPGEAQGLAAVAGSAKKPSCSTLWPAGGS